MPQLQWTTWAMVAWTVLCAVGALLCLSAPGVVIALAGAVYWAGMTALSAVWLLLRPIPTAYLQPDPS
jgi:hypothetical protein